MGLTEFIAGKTFYFALAHYAHMTQQPLGTTPVRLDHLLGALGLLAMVQYFINGLTISTIHALRSRRPILKSWRDDYLWTWWSFLGAAIATAVIYSAVTHLGLAFLVLTGSIISATFLTYQS